jgi:hypothetical protein
MGVKKNSIRADIWLLSYFMSPSRYNRPSAVRKTMELK